MTQTVLRSSARAVSINLDQPVQLVRSQYHDLLRLGIKPSKADQRFKITPTISVGSGGFYVTSRVDWRLVRNGDVELTRITGEEANEEGSVGHGAKSPRYYLTTDAPDSTEVVTYAISMAEAEPSGDREVTVHAAKGLSLLIEAIDGSPFDVVEMFVESELPAEDGGTVQPPVTPPTPPQPPGNGDDNDDDDDPPLRQRPRVGATASPSDTRPCVSWTISDATSGTVQYRLGSGTTQRVETTGDGSRCTDGTTRMSLWVSVTASNQHGSSTASDIYTPPTPVPTVTCYPKYSEPYDYNPSIRGAVAVFRWNLDGAPSATISYTVTTPRRLSENSAVTDAP